MSNPLEHLRFFLRMRKEKFLVQHPFRNLGAANRIVFGKKVRIRKHAWFAVTENCKVSIGDNTRIGRHFALSGVGSSITIENDVIISERVFITESYHDFEDITRPVQGTSLSAGPVRIGAESWIGIGVCIMPNVTIGKHCVIGANSTVTSDIPDYCIAVGSPAKVIKQYDFDKQHWLRVAPAPSTHP